MFAEQIQEKFTQYEMGLEKELLTKTVSRHQNFSSPNSIHGNTHIESEFGFE